MAAADSLEWRKTGETAESLRHAWAKWQGYVLNGTFPLQRYLGGSDHSGVFLTEFPAQHLAEAAVKLVPGVPTLAELQLSHWNTAAQLSHPNLMRLFETGRCELDGLMYLYAVMDFADQNLAQLLSQRAMTEDEAREMMSPVLEALEFLHGRNLVHGQLKPANILVVGDQLKLASDTIGAANEATASINMASAYDAPETRDGSRSVPADIWALGISLSEALTRNTPIADEHTGKIELPPDFPAAFREIVAACLHPNADDRPTVKDLRAWLRGEYSPAERRPVPPRAPAAAVPAPVPAAAAPSAVATGAAAASRPVRTPAAPPAVSPAPIGHEWTGQPAAAFVDAATKGAAASADRAPARDASPRGPSAVPIGIGAVVVAILVWATVHVMRTPSPPPNASEPKTATAAAPSTARAPESPSAPAAAEPAPGAAQQPSVGAKHPSTVAKQPPAAAKQPAAPAPRQSRNSRTIRSASAVADSSATHEGIPNVPRHALQTIHGHVRVSVRIIVDKQGNVFAALLDRPGSSRYFDRVAIDAAKTWKFPPDAADQRLKLVRFDFSREGAAAHAAALQ